MADMLSTLLIFHSAHKLRVSEIAGGLARTQQRVPVTGAPALRSKRGHFFFWASIQKKETAVMVDVVRREYARALKALSVDQRPARDSAFLRALKLDVGDAGLRFGRHRFVTLFSGGCYMAYLDEYDRALEHYAQDIRQGRVMTVNEIANNCDGIRPFFELDYRLSSEPSAAVLEKHAQMAHAVLVECFPGRSITLAVAKSSLAKVKGGQVAMGLHLVCPDLRVTTNVLRRLALLLDVRMTSNEAQYRGLVDTAPYHTETASLRLLFSHKMIDCPFCEGQASVRAQKDAQWGAGQVKELVKPTIEPEEPAWEPAEQCAYCTGSKKAICPSVYQPYCHIDALGVSDAREGDRLQQVRKFTIVPSSYGTHDVPVFPDDAPLVSDAVPNQMGAVYQTEQKSIQRRKDTTTVSPKLHPDVYGLVRKLLVELFPSHKTCAVDHVQHRQHKRPNKSILYINVKGRGARYCLHKGEPHRSNRVYFVIDCRRRTMAQHCYKAGCHKEKLSQHTIKIPIPDHEKLCALVRTNAPMTPIKVQTPKSTPTTPTPEVEAGRKQPVATYFEDCLRKMLEDEN